MNKLLCAFGFHKWYPENANCKDENGIVYATYLRCVRPACKKWGKCVFFQKIV